MFEQDYTNLYESEKEEFKRVANYILNKTFVLKDMYDRTSKKMIMTSEYLFMEKYFDLFEEYLGFAGYKIEKDTINCIYILKNELEYNKARLDSFTTFILLSLLVVYEESPQVTNFGNSVITTTYDVINKMQILGLITKKPSKEVFKIAFRKLEQYNVILRISPASADVEAWRIMILPSIHQVVDYDKLCELCDYIPSFIKEKYGNNEGSEETV